MNDTPTDIASLIMRDEGFLPSGSIDTDGGIVVGFGCNLKEDPLTLDEAKVLMQARISARVQQLDKLPWFNTLDYIRQAAIIDLSYQIGVHGLLGFKNMITALAAGNYQDAGDELENSKLDTQTPARTSRLAEQLRKGQWI